MAALASDIERARGIAAQIRVVQGGDDARVVGVRRVGAGEFVDRQRGAFPRHKQVGDAQREIGIVGKLAAQGAVVIEGGFLVLLALAEMREQTQNHRAAAGQKPLQAGAGAAVIFVHQIDKRLIEAKVQRVAPGLRGLLDMRGGGGEIGGKKIGERRIIKRGRVLRRQFQRRGVERSNVFGDDAGFGPTRVGQIDERRRDAGEILDHARESGRRRLEIARLREQNAVQLPPENRQVSRPPRLRDCLARGVVIAVADLRKRPIQNAARRRIFAWKKSVRKHNIVMIQPLQRQEKHRIADLQTAAAWRGGQQRAVVVKPARAQKTIQRRQIEFVKLAALRDLAQLGRRFAQPPAHNQSQAQRKMGDGIGVGRQHRLAQIQNRGDGIGFDQRKPAIIQIDGRKLLPQLQHPIKSADHGVDMPAVKSGHGETAQNGRVVRIRFRIIAQGRIRRRVIAARPRLLDRALAAVRDDKIINRLGGESNHGNGDQRNQSRFPAQQAENGRHDFADDSRRDTARFGGRRKRVGLPRFRARR